MIQLSRSRTSLANMSQKRSSSKGRKSIGFTTQWERTIIESEISDSSSMIDPLASNWDEPSDLITDPIANRSPRANKVIYEAGV